MKIAVIVSRILVGFCFVFFGANGFLQFLPADAFPPGPEKADAMIKFLQGSFLLQLLCAGHLLGGLPLLINRYVPFGLGILFSQVVTMLVFHILLDPAFDRAAIGYLTAALYFFLLYAYRSHFSGLLYAKADPEL